MKHYLLLATFCVTSILFGQNILTRGEVYDYDVGDQFQYSFDNYPGTMVDRYVVIDKQVSQNGDTVTYEMYKSHYFNDPNGDHFSEDTVSLTYTDLNTPITTFGDSSYIYDVYQDSSYYYYPDTIIEFDSNLCDLEVNGWDSYPPVFESNQIVRIYGRGIGLVRRYHYDPSSGGMTELENYNLYYYKKGNTTCGSPVTASLPPEDSAKQSVLVFPNPVDNLLQLKASHGLMVKGVSIYDAQGKEASIDFVEKDQLHYLNTLNLRDGMYTLVIELENKVVRKKVSVIH